jgi:hypothetical protein
MDKKMTVLSDKIRTARKDHRCDAADLLQEHLSLGDMVDDRDLERYESVMADGLKILKGQKYRDVTYIDGGDPCRWREGFTAGELCHKYEMYDES